MLGATDSSKVEGLRKRRALVEAALTERRDEIAAASNRFHAERLADHADALCSSLNGIDQAITEAQLPLAWLGRLRRDIGRAYRHAANVWQLHDDYASIHFRWDEFNCNDGTLPPAEAREAILAWCREIGEPLRDRFGPIHIVSAYRSEVHARFLGGVEFGLHLYHLHPNCIAVDVLAGEVNAAVLADAAEELADGLGRNTFFVHTDNRCRIGWPPARWWG